MTPPIMLQILHGIYVHCHLCHIEIKNINCPNLFVVRVFKVKYSLANEFVVQADNFQKDFFFVAAAILLGI